MVTSTDFQPIRIGQVWSCRGGRRVAEVVGATEHVNDPIVFGDRVSLRNVETGRYSHIQAATLRKHWKFEREAADDEQ